MIKLKFTFLIITGLATLCACNSGNDQEHTSGIEGLWVVTQVSVGEEELTPNAKWARFNADSTQQSGNGWFQHSTGTWRFDATKNELTIKTTNELSDQYPPFTVTFKNEVMIWNRMEDGQPVEVTLEPTDELPTSYGDELLGLWKLKSAVGHGKYFDESVDGSSNAFLFMRWDRLFTINSEKGRINGVYNVNAHRPEVELIPYGNSVSRDFWAVEYGVNSIKLTLLNSDSTVTREFVRIHEFPEN